MTHKSRGKPQDIPVFFVEDQQQPYYRLAGELHDIFTPAGYTLSIERAEEYSKAKSLAQRGDYPLAIIDLDIPNDEADASHNRGDYLGIDIISTVQRANKDAIIAVYSSWAAENLHSLVESHVHVLISKTDDSEYYQRQVEALRKLIVESYNYEIDPQTMVAIETAFGGESNHGSIAQWELCLRRFLRKAESEVVYNRISNGRSGAGVLTTYVDNRLPKVLKLDLYSKLADEVSRYSDYVKDFIRFHAQTSLEDLAQSGEVAVLAYSFVGMLSQPVTLARSIDKEDPAKVRNALMYYFKENCKQWFGAVNSTAKPFDLASACRSHFKVSKSALPSLLIDPRYAELVKTASEFAIVSEKSFVDRLVAATEADRAKVSCKAPSVIHGDLNANNLVWDMDNLWMIDFAKTGLGARMIDFVKLEASIKFDLPITRLQGHDTDDTIPEILDVERRLCTELLADTTKVASLPHPLSSRYAAVDVVRSCAREQCGSDLEANVEYLTALFFVTSKHVQFLAEDTERRSVKDWRLVLALCSSYWLALRLEDTELSR